MSLSSSHAVLAEGSTIGVVGGGQLGRMFTHTAQAHGYRVAVFTGGSQNTPAGTVADTEIAAGFDDDSALHHFVEGVDVVTWEFENVDLRVAAIAKQAGVEVHPSAQIVATTQDRWLEKEALKLAAVPLAPWRKITSEAQLSAAAEQLGLPMIVKAARFGYDGKGQLRVEHPNQVSDTWRALGTQRLVAEALVSFEREISVVVARSQQGEVITHTVMENHHINHVLDTTITPANISAEMANRAYDIATKLAHAWQLVGVMCVEMFVTPTALIVNEVAPRPHNSGHCTIEAAPASQFAQQLRALIGMPLGDGRCRPAAMVQLLGDLWLNGNPDWSKTYAANDVHLHLYGKREPHRGRKMGHMTAVGDDPRVLLGKLVSLREALR